MSKFKVEFDNQQCAIVPRTFSEYRIGEMITVNDRMKEIIELAHRVAKSDAPIMITGESGVGKELLSAIIHNNSNRKKEVFTKMNCAAITDTLKESEFFGYEAGAFTGALKYGKKGIFESAQSGTLFLDEIGELPLGMQSTLLRVLQDGVFTRVGGVQEIKSDARIICATNKNLEDLVEANKFRYDLYFRLSVIPIHIPPLNERRDDISLLTLYYIKRFNQQYNMNKRISKKVMDSFEIRAWNGNVRELKNTIERLVLISKSSIIDLDDLKYVDSITKKKDYIYFANQDIQQMDMDISLKKMVEDYEIEIIKRYVEKYGSIRKAARALSITPSTISRKLSKYDS